MNPIVGADGKHYPASPLTAKELSARRAIVRELRENGWSLRRIARELSWSAETVRRDLARAGDSA